MDLLSLIGFIGAVMAAASTGAMFPPGPWYDRLDKPGWTPPNWLFPLAWTALYGAMAYAAWRVAGSGSPALQAGLAFFAFQIALNAVWTPVFFGLRNLGGALVVIFCLLVAVVITCALFWRADTVAGLLFVPYIVWVGYASALNFDIWRRNGGGFASLPDTP